MKIALTREVSPSIARCELTHLDRAPIDLGRARAEHEVYCAALTEAGCDVHRLPAAPDLPDAVFVEDGVVVLDEVAVLTRPGAEPRRGELPSLAEALRPYRTITAIEAPGTLDGGDVLQIGNRIYVGLSRRTERRAIEQLRGIVSPFGYTVEPIPVEGCLHLKSAVTQIGEDRLLLNSSWVDPSLFADLDHLETDPTEAFAANALRIGETVLFHEAFPLTRRRLEKLGVRVRSLPAFELAKAEGGLTCCSVIFDSSAEV